MCLFLIPSKFCHFKNPLTIPQTLLFLTGILSSLIGTVQADNILFFIGPFSSHSHRSGLEPLANKLADKGHNVTFYGPLRPSVKHPKIINFCPPEVKSIHDIFLKQFGVIGLESRIKSKYNVDLAKGNSLFDTGIQMCEIMLKSSQFQSWVQISHFDLIVFDKSSMSDCAFALSYKWQSKVVSYSGIGCLIAWDSYSYGIPIESSWIPSFDVHYETREMSFYERASTEISFLSWYYNYYNYYLPRIDRLVRDYLDVEGMPPIHDVITSEQLIFMNIHYSDQFPRSLPPFVISVGGMHLTEQHGALSQELNTFINAGGDEGFMYISFGSIVSISSMPEHLLKNFLSAVRESKLQFVWKWEGVHPKNIPENLLLLPWIPQKILLAHPRIRGFITQGGQVSIQEAIYNAVPVIIIPVNGDQDYNAKRVRVMGNGIEVELYGMTSEVLSDAISRLLEDKRYAKMAKILSIASRERPVAALETAVWWTEFILRNDRNVTDILKPFCRHQPWWMKRSLDVWGFLFLSVILVFAGIIWTIKFWLTLLCKSRAISVVSEKSKIS